MDASQQNTDLSNSQPGVAQRLQHSKALVAIVAVLGVTVMALAAALVVNRSEAQPGVQPGSMAAMAPAAVPPAASNAGGEPAAKVAAEAHKPVSSSPSKHATPPAVVARANVCADCGTVEAVTAVQRQGQVNGVAVGNTTIGLGTVAGGVLGGLLGHQVGNGNGRTAATVLGVAGGAFAGNAVEKNMKKVTVYDVRVRMNDGSTRNLDISSAVPVGSKVIVEGKNLRMATAAG
ncbi:glycine zipper 2TM domain-containing protein [Polaromonas aquatica]|uniref:Glycine zipper 2TM domain-containing protein n=1 Tax=Polaromonas aquatica TaxID=332657 RepID=A0ABW1U3V4_9BURK